eukprot:TRINITY_DN5900_c0_g1_i7.p1 TRINITY_DN5900_c0_g1~~TRINITY_DN5900_c0_g1_i7.p1  ORF type:complete len:624 (-),score=47.41 TRINITY_DN5900_c0_g1_i7:87-1958(-)
MLVAALLSYHIGVVVAHRAANLEDLPTFRKGQKSQESASAKNAPQEDPCPSLCLTCATGEKVWINRHRKGVGFADFASAVGQQQGTSIATQVGSGLMDDNSPFKAVAKIIAGGSLYIAGVGLNTVDMGAGTGHKLVHKGLRDVGSATAQLVGQQGGTLLGAGLLQAPAKWATCSFEVMTSFEPPTVGKRLPAACVTFMENLNNESRHWGDDDYAAKCLAQVCPTSEKVESLDHEQVVQRNADGTKDPNGCLEKDFSAAFKHRLLNLDEEQQKLLAGAYQYTKGLRSLEPPETCTSICATCSNGKKIYIGRNADPEQIYAARVKIARDKYSDAWRNAKGVFLGTSAVVLAKGALAYFSGGSLGSAALTSSGVAVQGGVVVTTGVGPPAAVAATIATGAISVVQCALGKVSIATSVISASAGGNVMGSVAAGFGSVLAHAAVPYIIAAVALVGTTAAVTYAGNRLMSSSVVADYRTALLAPCTSTFYTVELESSEYQLSWHESCSTFDSSQVFSTRPVPWGDNKEANACLETLCGEGNGPDITDKLSTMFLPDGDHTRNLAMCSEKPEAVLDDMITRTNSSVGLIKHLARAWKKATKSVVRRAAGKLKFWKRKPKAVEEKIKGQT